MGYVSIVYTRDSLVLPPLTEGVLVVEEAEFLDDVVHDQVDVDCWLTADVFLVRFAKLADHVNGETLIGIKLEHAFDNTA